MKRLIGMVFILLVVACKDDNGAPAVQLTELEIEAGKIGYCENDQQCITAARPFSCDPVVFNRNEDPSRLLTLHKSSQPALAVTPSCKPSVYKLTCKESRCVAHFEKSEDPAPDPAD